MNNVNEVQETMKTVFIKAFGERMVTSHGLQAYSWKQRNMNVGSLKNCIH